MKTYDCELCGLTFEWQRGIQPRWCPDDRAEAYRNRPIPRPREPETLNAALAATVTAQRLAIQQATHALVLAALCRQLDWTDTEWLQRALDHLTQVSPVTDALSA